MKSLVLWIYTKVQNKDMYARTVNLTYKGQDTIRTFISGLVSLWIMIALLVNFSTSLYTLINRNDTRSYTKTIFKHSFNNEDKKYIGKGSFRLGMAYTSLVTGEIGNNLLSDQSYLNITFYNAEYHRSNGNRERTPHLMPSASWNDSYLGLVNQEVFDNLALDKYICPISDDYYLQGDYNSKIFRDIEVFVSPCNENNTQGVVWKPKEEIDYIIETGFINIAIMRTYFDYDDYENPVKTFFGETENYFMIKDLTTWASYQVQENTALRSDNLFYNEPFKESKFYDVGNKNIRIVSQAATGGALLFVTVGPHAETIQYERTVYSLLDLFGYLGGLYDFMLFIGFWLVNNFQDQNFYNLIFSNLYQVKSPSNSGDCNSAANMPIYQENKIDSSNSIHDTNSPIFRKF